MRLFSLHVDRDHFYLRAFVIEITVRWRRDRRYDRLYDDVSATLERYLMTREISDAWQADVAKRGYDA